MEAVNWSFTQKFVKSAGGTCHLSSAAPTSKYDMMGLPKYD